MKKWAKGLYLAFKEYAMSKRKKKYPTPTPGVRAIEYTGPNPFQQREEALLQAREDRHRMEQERQRQYLQANTHDLHLNFHHQAMQAQAIQQQADAAQQQQALNYIWNDNPWAQQVYTGRYQTAIQMPILHDWGFQPAQEPPRPTYDYADMEARIQRLAEQTMVFGGATMTIPKPKSKVKKIVRKLPDWF